MPPKKDKETILKEQLKFWNKAEKGIPFNMGNKRYYPTKMYDGRITTTSYPINTIPKEKMYPGGISGRKSRRNKKRKSAKRKSARRKSARRKSKKRKTKRKRKRKSKRL